MADASRCGYWPSASYMAELLGGRIARDTPGLKHAKDVEASFSDFMRVLGKMGIILENEPGAQFRSVCKICGDATYGCDKAKHREYYAQFPPGPDLSR